MAPDTPGTGTAERPKAWHHSRSQARDAIGPVPGHGGRLAGREREETRVRQMSPHRYPRVPAKWRNVRSGVRRRAGPGDRHAAQQPEIPPGGMSINGLKPDISLPCRGRDRYPSCDSRHDQRPHHRYAQWDAAGIIATSRQIERICTEDCRTSAVRLERVIGDLAALEVGQAVDRILPMELSAMNDHASLRIRMR
jgi:hypothetical protein